MFDRLKLAVLRRLVVVLVNLQWWRKRAQNLHIGHHTLTLPDACIGARSYHPEGEGPFPLMLFFHGGGFIGCNLDTHDALCRDLCVSSRHVVLSVDYRLAPEYPFPTAAKDCIASLVWALEHAQRLGADPKHLCVCGDSAGGNLAAVTVLHARDHLPGRVTAQVLIYPVTDHYSSGLPSYQRYGEGYDLTMKQMAWMLDLYLTDRSVLEPTHPLLPLAAPLRVEDLSGLPPTLILTAELDPLRDDGLLYVEKLRAQSVEVAHEHHPDQQHGFVGLKPSPAHRAAVAQIAQWLSASPATTVP